jgi:nucleoside phosphorylase
MDSIVPAERVDVLLLAAHGPDLRGFRAALGERFDGWVRGIHVTGKTVGVGLAVAAASTAKRAFQLDPRAIVHVGTCGVYPGGAHEPSDVVVADGITLVDHAVVAGRGHFPEPMQTSLQTAHVLSAGLAANGARTTHGIVATTLCQTTDDHFAEAVRTQHGAVAENLEAFGIAHACHLAEVPFTCVLAATHTVGSAGREQWQKYERNATLAAAEVVLSWLANGAQGMPHG